MSYSLSKHPNAPYEFPPPPPFLVWVQSYVWNRTTRTHSKIPEGQVRHVADLSKAKARVRSYAKPWRHSGEDGTKFSVDWAIYHWSTEVGEYELQFEGKSGETIATNSLFTTRMTKTEKHQPRPGLEDEVEKALASIRSAL